MSWRGEFGDDYDVPQWFENHPDLTDTSWHNDVSPSFETHTDHPDYPENARVRIWVEHPDPAQRETSGRYRYWIQFTGEGDDQNGIHRYCDDIEIVETDDLSVVDCLLRWAQDLIAKHGLSMCPSYEGDPRVGIFPKKGHPLFDPSGAPNFPGLAPLPPPCGTERPRGELERALEQVQAHRRSLGLPPLDPEAAEWTERDVIEEAERIRLKNRLMAP